MIEYIEGDWGPINTPMKKGYVYIQNKVVAVYKDGERVDVNVKDRFVMDTDTDIEIESVGNGEVLVDVSREEALQLIHALEEFDKG